MKPEDQIVEETLEILRSISQLAVKKGLAEKSQKQFIKPDLISYNLQKTI